MNLKGYGYGSNVVAMSSPTINKLRFDLKTFVMRNKLPLAIVGGIIGTYLVINKKKVKKRLKKLW